MRPADQRIVDQSVLHIDQNPDRRIDAGELLDRENRLEERAAAAAVLLWNFDAHQSELVKLLDQGMIHHAALIHLLYQRTDGLFGKPADVVAKKLLVFSQGKQRLWQSIQTTGSRHGKPTPR